MKKMMIAFEKCSECPAFRPDRSPGTIGTWEKRIDAVYGKTGKPLAENEPWDKEFPIPADCPLQDA